MPNRASGPVWERSSRPVRERSDDRAPLTLDAIVPAALAVADADGLGAVSIRRVAAELGARPMSLYSHIAAKDELIDLMADALVGEMLVAEPPSGDWRADLGAVARRFHAVFVSHPWALEAFGRRPRPGPNVAAHAKQLAAAAAGLKLDAREMWTAVGIVDDFVLGHALRVSTSGNAADLEAVLTEADRAELPALGSLTAVNRERASRESFEVGLGVVLDGIAARFGTG